MSIVCTGSIAYDYLMSFPGYFKDHILPDRLDSISLSFLVDSMVRQRGGTGPNIAFTLALLGEKPLLMGTVGEDFEDYRCWLENHGVDTRYIRVVNDVYTASFFANTDKANAQISSFYAGAMAYAKEQSIHDLQKETIDLVVISANDPTGMRRFARECRELEIPYLYDPGQQVVRSPAEEIREGIIGAQSLFVNEYEFELIQKHTGLTQEDIREEVDYVVVTCGECGSDIWVKDEYFHIPIVKPVQIADPTGVGDAFRGGFLRGRRLDFSWQTCGQMGALAATYCLEQRGTQNHSYTRAEFISRYEKEFGSSVEIQELLN